MKRNKLFLCTSIVFLLLIIGCSLYLRSTVLLHQSAIGGQSLVHAEWILQKVKVQTNAPKMEDFPPDIRYSIASENLMEQCWTILQKAMMLSHNQYTTRVVSVYGKEGTPFPSPVGSTQSVIEVVFPNGMSVQLEYYNSTLEVCHSVSDNK